MSLADHMNAWHTNEKGFLQAFGEALPEADKLGLIRDRSNAIIERYRVNLHAQVRKLALLPTIRMPAAQ